MYHRVHFKTQPGYPRSAEERRANKAAKKARRRVKLQAKIHAKIVDTMLLSGLPPWLQTFNICV